MKKLPKKQQIFQNRPAVHSGLRLAEWVAALLAVLALTATVVFLSRLRADAASFSLQTLKVQSQAEAGEGMLNLNTADEELLTDLPGIGPVLAGRIIAWREENGAFTCPEDVMEVKGIAEATWAKIAPYVTF